MRHLGASVAVFVVAMTFSLTPLSRSARASENKPVIRSMMDRNAILPLATGSSTTITLAVQRYMTPLRSWGGWPR